MSLLHRKDTAFVPVGHRTTHFFTMSAMLFALIHQAQ